MRVWSVPDGEPIGELTAHQLTVRAMAASPTEELLATSGEDRRILLWDMTRREVVATLTGHESEVHALAFSSDGEWLASGGKDDTVRLWKVHADRGTDLIADAGSRYGLAHPLLSPDGRIIAVNSSSDDLKLYDVATRLELRKIGPGRKPVAFSPDGRFLATVITHGLLEVWDVNTGAARGAVLLARVPDPQTRAALSPDGSLIGICSGTGTNMYLCDTRDGRELARVATHGGLILGASFSPDGKWLATCAQDGVVRVWNVGARASHAVLRGHKADVRGLAFSPDSRTLATSSFDDEVKIWHVEDGREITTLRGHKSPVNAVAFTSDGRSLLSLSDDSLRFWNVAIWREAGAINTPQRNRLMTLSAAGNVAAMCDGMVDGPVRFIRAGGEEPGELSGRATQQASWTLTNLPPWRDLIFRGGTIPHRPHDTPAQCLDLTAHYNGLLDGNWISLRDKFPLLPDLLKAPRTLAGVEWDIRGAVQLDGQRQRQLWPVFPEAVRDIAVNRPCAKIHFLTSIHYGQMKGKEAVASFIFLYANGETASRDVKFGLDVADWWYPFKGSPSLPGMTVAWTGSNEASRAAKFGLRLFRVTWENPRPDLEVRSVDLVSGMQFPSLFVCAITVE